MTEQDQDHPIDPLPPSAKAAWLALRYEGPLTNTEIKETTRLSERSANRAIQELTRVDLARRQPSDDGDARCVVYSLHDSV